MARLAIDIGGTFTDVVAETADGMASAKVLTDHQNPELPAVEGFDQVLPRLSAHPSELTDIIHGTTLATNALIERKGARTALVTTSGFRDVLEMRHEKRFDQYALDIELPEPLVPRPLRFGLKERILADGTVAQSPCDADIQDLARRLCDEGVEAVAIGFLHSYRNPSHENGVARRLIELLGNQVTVCQSAEIACEIREYERFSTACANAYVRPLMIRYLRRLEDRLRARGFSGSFFLMASNGGLTTLERAMRFPIALVEGGPAGGVALAAHVAREMRVDRTLSLDIGGTTAKICFIEDGRAQTTRRFEVSRAWRDTKGSGLPIRIPSVELVEIGAGGGSIASVDGLKRLKVGPESAGSSPGPVAYDLGGTNVTVTDAHFVVGNLSSEGFAGGVISVDGDQARSAMAEQVQTPLEMDQTDAAAAGVIEIADETMANAARVHGIELGLDISRFQLLVSGGGGGLHAARIAEKLGISRIIVPKNAGVGSAIGFLRSPVSFETALSVVAPLATLDPDLLRSKIGEVVRQVRAIVARSVPDAKIAIEITAELRYAGQGLEIRIPVPDLLDNPDRLDNLPMAFEAAYAEAIGYSLENLAIELVSINVRGEELRSVSKRPKGTATLTSRGETRRSVFDLKENSRLNYLELDRGAVGNSASRGPVVLPEAQTTTLVRPGWSVHQSEEGHLVLERIVP